MNIGEKIIELRKGGSYTQEKLANKYNVFNINCINNSVINNFHNRK